MFHNRTCFPTTVVKTFQKFENFKSLEIQKTKMSVVDEAYVRKISDLEQSNENLQSYVKRLEIQLREYQLEMPDFQSNEDDIDQKERESDRPLPVTSIDRSPTHYIIIHTKFIRSALDLGIGSFFASARCLR